MASLSGQTILVTGASGGIGSAVARRLAQAGATVCLSGRDRNRLESLAAEFPERTRIYPADLASEEEIRSAVRQLLADNLRLDAVIHSAAIIKLGRVLNAPVKDFERQLQTNVVAPFLLTQLLLPAIISSRGQVIFINSSAGRRGRAGVGQYAASKHALKALADSLRRECNEDGVRVCTLFLGSTATPMQAAVRADQHRPYHPELLIQPEDVAQVIETILALPRTAEITELSIRPATKA